MVPLHAGSLAPGLAVACGQTRLNVGSKVWVRFKLQWIVSLLSQSRAGGGSYSSKNRTCCLVAEQPGSAMVLVWLYNLAQFHPRLPRNTMFKFSEVALILLGLKCLCFLFLD